MATNFVSSSRFSLSDDILKKLRRSAFITGTAVGPEETRATIEGALSVDAERESRLAQIGEDRRQREESLAQQQSQFELSLESRQRSEARDRKTALFAGAGKVGAQILFSPFSATTSKAGVTTFSTLASKIGGAIKRLFI